jgi:hypothetical protein
LGTTFLSKIRRSAAQTKPTIGESKSVRPMFSACFQSTPLVATLALTNWLAMPTPMIEPMSVCELDDGNPKYHVPRFQMMAAVKSANTMENPAPLPTCRISSTGRSEMIPNATPPVDSTTPRKFHNPDQTTATCGSRVCV